MEKHDIDKLMMAADGINGVVSVGEKVMADGVVSFADAEYADDLFMEAKKLVEAFKHVKEMGSEIKDIDLPEALMLLQKMFK